MVATVTSLNTDNVMELMGIKAKRSTDLIATIREGLPFETFTTLQTTLDISALQLAALIGMPNRTLSRRKKEGYFKSEESDNLLRIARVLSRVLDFFGDEVEAIDWLKTPARAFDGETPLALLDTEVGAQEVLRLIGQLEYGVFP